MCHPLVIVRVYIRVGECAIWSLSYWCLLKTAVILQMFIYFTLKMIQKWECTFDVHDFNHLISILFIGHQGYAVKRVVGVTNH